MDTEFGVGGAGELGRDCDTTWEMVAEWFLVEGQMISSKLEW